MNTVRCFLEKKFVHKVTDGESSFLTEQFNLLLKPYLKFCMFMHIFSSLSVQNKLSFICNTNYMVLHGMAQ